MTTQEPGLQCEKLKSHKAQHDTSLLFELLSVRPHFEWTVATTSLDSFWLFTISGSLDLRGKTCTQMTILAAVSATRSEVGRAIYKHWVGYMW